ncbi:hypothetical protein KI688_009389 [Linnemannia hyalina]|uniref:DUF1751-domain-containing protein n=1 Tax=Linnemannia hyalina TaxID=64524 RepID=A0A9P8BV54_9FUNG|nr:hypothetical protein KI688_009389 [Linnemannia hyalina]
MPSAPPSWKATFSNVPPLTKSVSTAMTIMTALGLMVRVRDLLIRTHNGDVGVADGNVVIVVPGSDADFLSLIALVPVSAPFRFWTFATASFFERNIIMYAINTFILLGCGKYLERAWGSRELFKYLSITSVGTMLGIYFTCVFEYVVRSNDALLYDTQAYGLTGVVAGFLIGFKQLVPEHLVTVWGVFSIRSLPLLFAIVMFLGAFVTHTQIELLMAIYGLFISWIYTRFLKVQDGIRGDRSETFSFASFFPEFIQPPVKAVSNFFFGILVKLQICSPTGYGGSFQYDLENPQMAGMGHTFTQPGSLRAEAERRRALALKALDMRLHAASGGGLSVLSSIGRSNTAGRDGASGNVPRVSLLSLSAEPEPTGGSDSDDENEVLFETSALDVNSKSEVSSESPAPARTKRNSDGGFVETTIPE